MSVALARRLTADHIDPAVTLLDWRLGRRLPAPRPGADAAGSARSVGAVARSVGAPAGAVLAHPMSAEPADNWSAREVTS